MAGAPLVVALLAPGLLLAQAAARHPAPPPLPPIPPAASPRPLSSGSTDRLGQQVVINGATQRARWLWVGGDARRPAELWLPLEVLQNQLGVSSRTRSTGDLELDWFGTTLTVPAGSQRSLDDEVAVNALALLQAGGVSLERQGQRLLIERPATPLLQVRSGNGGLRLVLDLGGPALVRTDADTLLITARASADQLASLRAWQRGPATPVCSCSWPVGVPAGCSPSATRRGWCWICRPPALTAAPSRPRAWIPGWWHCSTGNCAGSD